MATVADLKRKFAETITDDDTLMAILRTLDMDELPKDPSFIHKAMYEVKLRNSDDLFKNFRFDTSGITPFSDRLDQVIFRLETTHILSTMNPSYELYKVEKNELEKALHKFPQEKMEVIYQAGDIFRSCLTSVTGGDQG